MITYNLVIFIFALLQYMVPSYAVTNKPTRCVFARTDIFNNCKSKKKSFKHLQRKGKLGNTTNEVCKNEGICQTKFNITYLQRQLYNKKVFNQFSEMLDGCCGDCVSYTIANTISRISEIMKCVETSDFIFPILTQQSVKELYGLYYIPVLEVPSAYYFTLKATKQETMISLIMVCLGMWPLLVICSLMACISGFIIWIMERRANSAEFSKRFHVGISEGIWWSFISMTTVGYGDKSPKSCYGRLFALLWILIGITIFSLFSGSLTNQIIKIHSHQIPQIHGKKVGGLRHRFHDATMVAQHGGFFQVIDYNDTVVGVMDLIKRLKRKEIDGFILSRPSYYFFSSRIKRKRYKEQAARIKHVEMHRTVKQYLGEKLTLGMLVKNVDNYEYFRKYFEDNWLQIQDCNAFNLNFKAKKFEPKLFTSFKGLFYDFLYGILIILAIIGCYGLFQEGQRCYVRYKTNKTVNEEGGRLHELRTI